MVSGRRGAEQPVAVVRRSAARFAIVSARAAAAGSGTLSRDGCVKLLRGGVLSVVVVLALRLGAAARATFSAGLRSASTALSSTPPLAPQLFGQPSVPRGVVGWVPLAGDPAQVEAAARAEEAGRDRAARPDEGRG